MLKTILRILGLSKKDDLSGLGLEIRELIKGKEIDPQKLIELQGEINKIEAQHRTIFVAGWRPFIGWVCGFVVCSVFVLLRTRKSNNEEEDQEDSQASYEKEAKGENNNINEEENIDSDT